MTSTLKVDELQNSLGGSGVKVGSLKHPDASGTNITLASDGSATINQISSSSVFPSGHILQVQQAVKDTHETYSSADGGDSQFQDITGTDQGGAGSIFCCKITPSAASSKIMIIACMSFGSEDYSGYFKFMKKVGSGSYADLTGAIGTLKTGSWSMASFAATGGTAEDAEMSTNTMMYLDSPNTESELHYKVQGTTRHNDTWSINRSENNVDGTYHFTTISTITLWEIAG